MQSSLTLSTDRPDRRQALLALAGMLLGLTVFIAVERLVTPRYGFVTPLDAAIPFVPQTWYVYVLFFPFVVVASAYATAGAFRDFRNATLLAFAIGLTCFVLFPESVPRPDPTLIENAFLRHRFVRLWGLDFASNGLPSLHVAVTCLACRMLWPTRYRWIVAGIGVSICVSTLTVKQHTTIDVIGGAALAVLCGMLAVRRRTAQVRRGHA